MTKYNYEFKVKIVAEYLAGIGSTTLAHRYDIPSGQIIIDWVNKFQTYGVEGLECTHRKQIYSSDFKQQVLNWMKQHQTYTTKDSLIQAMTEWLDYYNQRRIKTKLKGRTLVQCRLLALNQSLNIHVPLNGFTSDESWNG